MCISGDIISLSCLLSSEFRRSKIYKSLKLSRKDRKEISIQVTTALLLLYSTPWITSDWNGAEIVFENLDRNMSSSNLRPYISRRFSAASKCSPNAALSDKNTQETIFRLGVLLLELCIGESLDQHCLEIGKARTRETEFDIVSEWWQQEAGTAEGPEVAEVIKKCLFFKFQTNSNNLLDEELRRAIYNEVVQPLREVPRNFNPKWMAWVRIEKPPAVYLVEAVLELCLDHCVVCRNWLFFSSISWESCSMSIRKDNLRSTASCWCAERSSLIIDFSSAAEFRFNWSRWAVPMSPSVED